MSTRRSRARAAEFSIKSPICEFLNQSSDLTDRPQISRKLHSSFPSSPIPLSLSHFPLGPRLPSPYAKILFNLATLSLLFYSLSTKL